jgi:hypothetical protein
MSLNSPSVPAVRVDASAVPGYSSSTAQLASMTLSDTHLLTAFVTQSARNIVLTQQLFDHAAGPPRMRIARCEIQAELAVSVRRAAGYAISLTPLNASYRVLRQDTSEASLSITLTMEQVAHPGMSGQTLLTYEEHHAIQNG